MGIYPKFLLLAHYSDSLVSVAFAPCPPAPTNPPPSLRRACIQGSASVAGTYCSSCPSFPSAATYSLPAPPVLISPDVLAGLLLFLLPLCLPLLLLLAGTLPSNPFLPPRAPPPLPPPLLLPVPLLLLLLLPLPPHLLLVAAHCWLPRGEVGAQEGAGTVSLPFPPIGSISIRRCKCMRRTRSTPTMHNISSTLSHPLLPPAAAAAAEEEEEG